MAYVSQLEFNGCSYSIKDPAAATCADVTSALCTMAQCIDTNYALKTELCGYATCSEVTCALGMMAQCIGENYALKTELCGLATTEYVDCATCAVQQAVEGCLGYYALKTELCAYATTQYMDGELAKKQDVISDLDDIRTGAALGETAVQPCAMATAITEAVAPKADKVSGATAGNIAALTSDGNLADSGIAKEIVDTRVGGYLQDTSNPDSKVLVLTVGAVPTE